VCRERRVEDHGDDIVGSLLPRPQQYVLNDGLGVGPRPRYPCGDARQPLTVTRDQVGKLTCIAARRSSQYFRVGEVDERYRRLGFISIHDL
jgi:hypothetical protein